MKNSELTERNRDIQVWGKAQISPLRKEIKALGIKKYSGQMHRFLKDRYFRYNGRINGIGFKMPQHAVFVHKGVGRGYPIDAVGGKAQGLSRNQRSKNLKGKGYNQRAINRFLSNSEKLKGKPRKPKPWFNPIIDRSLPKLADTVAKHNADIAARNVFIL